MLPRRLLLAGCGIVTVVVAVSGRVWGEGRAGAFPYERITEQLSQAAKACQELAGRMGGYDVVFRRDPTRPLVDAQGTLMTSVGLHDGWAVQGIIWSEDHPLIVADDVLLAQGDVIGPYTIVEIRPTEVVVQRGAETLTVPLDRGLEPLPAPIPATKP